MKARTQTTIITGTAGFIGHHLTRRLAEAGETVIGVDNLNDYYDPALKLARLAEIGITPLGNGRLVTSTIYPNLSFVRTDLTDDDTLDSLFRGHNITRVCHLAAQAGVRYSLTNPNAYVASNIQGFLNILEAVRRHSVQHLVYASSSSVYGIDTEMPFKETAAADHPASLYAVSKRSNELMAHSYAHLYGIPSTGLRFFTVYGPWGRPDMAYYLFADAITAGEPIKVFNNGNMKRDFTYVDDIVEGIVRVLDTPPEPQEDWDGVTSGVSTAPYRVYNIGNGAPVDLMEFIEAIETELGKKARKVMMPMQDGDVIATWADCSALDAAVGYRPSTPVKDGIREFIRWYRSYHNV